MNGFDSETSIMVLVGNGFDNPAKFELSELNELGGVVSRTTRTALGKLVELGVFLREDVAERPREEG
jgi:hypothetical protein